MKLRPQYKYLRHDAKIKAIENKALLTGTIRGSDGLFLTRQIRILEHLLDEIISIKEAKYLKLKVK